MNLSTLKREILDMKKLKEIASSPIWDQGYTKDVYIFPLPQNKDFMEDGKTLAIGNPEDETYIIGTYYAATSPQSHIGPYKWAIDFLVPDGTEVLAVNDGVIIEAIDRFFAWGDSEEFRDQLNYITIRHANGEFSQYCHLATQSFRQTGLKVGDFVKRGQQIARVGKTGWTDRDHLHFLVFNVGELEGNPYGFYSLKIRFQIKGA